MELQDFIAKFAEQFEETSLEQFTQDLEFKSLDEWSSLTTLSIIAMVDDSYGVTIKGDEIRKSETINDLFELVKSKK